MSSLFELRDQVARDRKITDDEVQIIQDYIRKDGRLNLEDVKLLVELLCDADEVCPAFDNLFFPVLRNVLLADGEIGLDEQFYLLKMIYSDGHVRECEKEFLLDLRRDIAEVSPEFDSLCEAALAAPARDWELGGSPR